MTSSSDQFDPSREVPGELSYLGYDTFHSTFSFNDVVHGIQSLDGDEVSGLHFQFGTPMSDAQIRQTFGDDHSLGEGRPMTMTGDTFSVGGGGAEGYICYVATRNGPVWLTSNSGDPEDIIEVDYDCGCDVEQGIFPGNFLVTYEEVVEAASFFFQTGELIPRFRWVSQDDLGFDPWYTD